MKLFTPDDYVLARVAQYPSLYSDASLDGAKLRVFDQLFNVIGNGIRDIGELRADLKYHKFNRDRALRAISGEEVYYGYYDFEMIGDYKFPRGDSVTALESEKANHPDVKVWSEAGNTSKRCAKLGMTIAGIRIRISVNNIQFSGHRTSARSPATNGWLLLSGITSSAVNGSRQTVTNITAPIHVVTRTKMIAIWTK